MRRAKDIDGLLLATLILATWPPGHWCCVTLDSKAGSPSIELILDSFSTWALWVCQGAVHPVSSFDWAALISAEHLGIMALLSASLLVPEIAEPEGGVDSKRVL